MKNKNNQSGFINHFGLFVIIGLVVLVISLAGVRVWQNRDQMVADASADCLVYKDNRRILCHAKKLTGYRYANYFNPDLYKYVWGVPVNGTLGQDPAVWVNSEQRNSSRNFLECSGFVNVVFYQANRNRTVFQQTNSQMYQNYTGYLFNRVNDLKNSLKPGDLIIIAKDKDTKIGHVAVFSHYEYVFTTKVMVTYEASSSGNARSGRRERSISQFDYALRYKSGLLP